MNGEVYGFVRFSKVRDVGKLLRAVNAVCFGSFRVQAKIARFDRGVNGEPNGEKNGDGVVGKPDVVVNRDGTEGGFIESTRGGIEKLVGGGGKNEKVGRNGFAKGILEGAKVLGKDEEVVEVVRVGDVVVTVRDGKGSDRRGRGVMEVDGMTVKGRMETTEAGEIVCEKKLPSGNKLVRMYRSDENDLQWAHSGVMANVVNGEAFTVVRSRVEDAGFVDLDMIPMGADRVFLRSNSEKETLSLLGEA